MLKNTNNFFASRTGIISVGALIGLLVFLLQKFGNPGNMGLCITSFIRDSAGAFGLHRSSTVQYLRPELPGLILGAFIPAFLFKEFRTRLGSSPMIRFFLGIFAAFGTIVFLGDPLRTFFRIAGGDYNAIIGLLGLSAGIGAGALFLRSGFTLGKSGKVHVSLGYLFPVLAAILTILVFVKPAFMHFSQKGSGSVHAPVILSLVIGLVIGFVAQRSRFCTIGGIRDLLLTKDSHLVSGAGAMLLTVIAANIISGVFHPGFTGQPVAQSNHAWNFAGMALAGLAFTLAGGCPGRQLFMASEGNLDSGSFIMGMIIGVSFAHNIGIVSRPDLIVDNVLHQGSVSSAGMGAVVIGLLVCVILGFKMRDSENREEIAYASQN